MGGGVRNQGDQFGIQVVRSRLVNYLKMKFKRYPKVSKVFDQKEIGRSGVGKSEPKLDFFIQKWAKGSTVFSRFMFHFIHLADFTIFHNKNGQPLTHYCNGYCNGIFPTYTEILTTEFSTTHFYYFLLIFPNFILNYPT